MVKSTVLYINEVEADDEITATIGLGLGIKI